MFKFLTQGAKIMRIRSGIIALAPLAVLAAVITTLALSSFTAEAQGKVAVLSNGESGDFLTGGTTFTPWTEALWSISV